MKTKTVQTKKVEIDGRIKYSDEERKHAVVLYLEVFGFRRIARIMSKLFGKNYRYQNIMH